MFSTLYASNKIISDRLRQLRNAGGLRQCDLAKRLGCSQATVSNVECGERQLDVIELRQWLLALDGNFLDFVRQLDRELQVQEIPTHKISRRRRSACPRLPCQVTLRQISSMADLVRQATARRQNADD